ncbi:MAG TPA: hypothetical protein VMN60_07500 [Longimicrobiales bacterium]|nr:hypothetical protein [Longimicrobiales bacterium]
MTATMRTETAARPGTMVARDTGLVGRVAVTWAVGGGLLLGGFLVAAMTLAGRLSGNALLLTAGALYVIGGLFGFVHGAALGFFGRPADVTAGEAMRRIGMAALYAMPALAVGFIAAGWIAMTMVALYLDRTLPMIGAGAGWVVGLAVLLAATVSGAQAMRNAYARWPDRRLGTVLVAATFAALLVLFLADRPELWGLRLRVTEVGAILLAAVGAFWVAGPVVTIGLGLLRRLQPAPMHGLVPAPRAVTSVVIGLAAGTILAIAAVPFHQAAFGVNAHPGTLGGAILIVSRALVDEVLLRLFAVTGVVWLLLRWQAMPRARAAGIAIVAAALAQVALYVPGVQEIGFATPLAAAAYTIMAVLVPALVFGVLYWKRGFASALVADAAALAALALLV